jgi:BlaI family transcriptional regulator, penicillinase repressor
VISEAESEIMKVLWSEPGMTAEAVQQALKTDWHHSTVKTLLGRLISKDVLRAEKHGRRFHYFPTVSKEHYLAAETQSFLQRVFDGRLAPIFTHFAQFKGLKRSERDALKRLLQELDDDAP